MIVLRNLKMPLKYDEKSLEQKILKTLKIQPEQLLNYEIVKKAIDSRKKTDIFYIFNLNILLDYQEEKRVLKYKNVSLAKQYDYKIEKISEQKREETANRPIIIGSGPAGLLAGIILAEAGLKPLIIEQGKDVDTRQKEIKEFWKTGKLNVNSNVQFGAGGAGTFSDGKLTTGINNDLKLKLIDELILAGAPEEIKYIGKPHLGTDILINIVRNLCKKIEKLGGEIKFETKFLKYNQTDNKLQSIIIENTKKQKVELKCKYLILAIGHSARDTFKSIYDSGIALKAKPFAVGVRIEHLQKDVNTCQYGNYAVDLEAASYKLNTKINERTLHTFCMCPGGVVVGAASEKNRVVTNGMSYSKRDLKNSNSALLVNINIDDFNGEENPLNGIEFQRNLEEAAFKAGGSNYFAPVQKVGDFLNKKKSTVFFKIKPSYLPGTKSVNLHDYFPGFIMETLAKGIEELSHKIDFLKDEEAVLTAIESRSSSPITIIRDEKFMSNIHGIIPCGEGAGYAGGIVSAGIDGIKCAKIIINNINNN